jgi:hypothetical protein
MFSECVSTRIPEMNREIGPKDSDFPGVPEGLALLGETRFIAPWTDAKNGLRVAVEAGTPATGLRVRGPIADDPTKSEDDTSSVSIR